ncbi:MAG: hypothetical protein P8Y97_15895 [Candidatus Lokiarchaeota archaeon]
MVKLKSKQKEKFKEKINEEYSKIKKGSQKLIEDVQGNLVEIKVCMDHFLESGEDKVDSKAMKSLNFFSDRIKKEINEVEVPKEEMTFSNILKLVSSIKRLFININDVAKKSLPKFKSEVQTEIKELNYLTRKLQKKQAIVEKYMRNKYTPVKEAEELLEKLPKFFNLRDNIENAKTDLDEFEKEKIEIEENLEDLNSQLLDLEKDELFKELDSVRDKIFKLRLRINNQMEFKKALKKLRVEVERENLFLTNLDINYLKEFLKNPIRILVNEDKDSRRFTSLLVQLRHALEENKLNLKSDKREKSIEQINDIFDNRALFDDIEKYKGMKEEVKRIQDKIKVKGLDEKVEEIKNEISLYTVKLEHIENDINRKNRDYLRYLANLKNEREEFQEVYNDIMGEDLKLTITFSF